MSLAIAPRDLARRIKRWTNSPALDDPAELTLYRCTECGHVAHDLGTIHGHIEKHRPMTRFWQLGRHDFLDRRTEVLEYELVSREIRDPLRQSFRELSVEFTDGFIDAFRAALRYGVYRDKLRRGRHNAEALADAIGWDDRPATDGGIQHPRTCDACGARTYAWERCHVCGDVPWKGGETGE